MDERVSKLLTNEMNAVYRLARHLCPKSADVDDLVQETYLRAFRAADRFQLTDHGPKPWLFKILYNLICSGYSAKKREDDAIRHFQHEPASPSTAPDVDGQPEMAHVDWDRIDERLKHALDSLTLTARTTFLLCAVEGLKYKEIAQVTESAEGTVMSRLYRARADLAQHLGVYAQEQGWTKASRVVDSKSSKIVDVKHTEVEA